MDLKVTRCIFCERTDLSNEHIWPIWSHPIIRAGASNFLQKQFVKSPKEPVRRETFSKSRHGEVVNMRLKVVCRKHCNNGWMSNYETKVRSIITPLFLGERASLNKYNQEILATWIAMKLITCEFSNPANVVTPARDRALVMGKRSPPDIMKIWIGRYQGRSKNNYVRHSATFGWPDSMPKPLTDGGDNFAKNTQTQTLVLGQLFIQTISTTVSGLAAELPASYAPSLKQIWPFQREFIWPPPTIDDGLAMLISFDLDRLADRMTAAGRFQA